MHVYLIQNIVNGKCYVGQHSGDDLDWYWDENCKAALRGNKGKTLLYRAIRKYGPESFSIHSLVNPKNKEEMDSYEIAYIKLFGTKNKELGYNCTAGGEGILGFKFSEEQCEANRQRALKQGIPKGFREGQKKYLETRVFSDEYRQNLSDARKGITYSKDTLEKMSISKLKDKCKNGHDKSGDNVSLVTYPNGRVYTRCRLCSNAKSRAYQAALRERTKLLEVTNGSIEG